MANIQYLHYLLHLCLNLESFDPSSTKLSISESCRSCRSCRSWSFWCFQFQEEKTFQLQRLERFTPGSVLLIQPSARSRKGFEFKVQTHREIRCKSMLCHGKCCGNLWKLHFRNGILKKLDSEWLMILLLQVFHKTLSLPAKARPAFIVSPKRRYLQHVSGDPCSKTAGDPWRGGGGRKGWFVSEAMQHKGDQLWRRYAKIINMSVSKDLIVPYSAWKNLTTSHVPCFRRIKWMRLQMQWKPSLTDSEKIGTLQRRRLVVRWFGGLEVWTSWLSPCRCRRGELRIVGRRWIWMWEAAVGLEKFWTRTANKNFGMTFALDILTTLTTTWQHWTFKVDVFFFQKISHQMTFWAAPQSGVRTRPACSWAKVMFPKWTT